MESKRPKPTGREVIFSETEIIVSKTDPRSIITYANDVFRRVSGYSEAELIGKPHNIIRHPDMPACLFKIVWDTLKSGREIFAYVVNLCKNGDHYWVFAHMTPSFGPDGAIVGFHSNRRVPHADALPKVQALYHELRSIERTHASRAEGMQAAATHLQKILDDAKMTYSEFVFQLSRETTLLAAVS